MSAARSPAGQLAHATGTAAEAQVLRHYLAGGHRLVAQRWRGQAGEIDLILRDDARHVLVEVKAARDLDTAATRLAPRQIRRLAAAAEEFLATLPGGLATELRFDVALVDRSGRIRILENALIDA